MAAPPPPSPPEVGQGRPVLDCPSGLLSPSQPLVAPPPHPPNPHTPQGTVCLLFNEVSTPPPPKSFPTTKRHKGV